MEKPLPPCHTGKLGTNTLMALVLSPGYLDCSITKQPGGPSLRYSQAACKTLPQKWQIWTTPSSVGCACTHPKSQTGGSLEPKQHNEMCGWVAQWQSEYPASTRPWVQSPPSKLYKTLRLLQLHTRTSTAVADTEISGCSGILPVAMVKAAFQWTPPCWPWKQSKVESTGIILSWTNSV